MKYLGKIVSREGYRDDSVTTEAIEQLKSPPNTVGDLRQKLGFIGYYRNSIEDFSRKAKPLYELLTKEAEPTTKPLKANSSKKTKGHKSSKDVITWLPKHQSIVLQFIELLKSPIIMSYPDFEKPFVVHCDASEIGLGAVLYQKVDEQLKVISYASRTLTPAEKNYHLHSGKLEFLALKWAVTEKFREYLYYGLPFTVYSDNNPLSYALTTAKLNAAGMRWIAELSDFNFTIKYRAGKESIDCDYLSRHPVNINDLIHTCDKEIDQATIGTTTSSITANTDYVSQFPQLVNQLTLHQDVESINPAEVKQQQLQDEVIAPVYRMVKYGITPTKIQMKSMSKKSKVLLRYIDSLSLNEDQVLVKKNKQSTQIVLPTFYHQLVFKELHEKKGHLGPDRVLELAKR